MSNDHLKFQLALPDPAYPVHDVIGNLLEFSLCLLAHLNFILFDALWSQSLLALVPSEVGK
jgi:hypothetical protein